jgi:hypothetical protein
MRRRLLAVVVGILFVLPTARGDENRVVHVLLIADTVDKKVGSIAGQDLQTMGWLIKNSIPRDRLSMRILAGEDATPDNVARYYAGLEVDPHDAVVLYYCGHGGWDADRGPVLVLNAGTMVRSDLVRLMRSKGGRLTVLLSNSCSNAVRISAFGKDEDATGIVPDHGFSPVLRCLFFQHEGLVDITAAKRDTSAFGDPQGSWFTIALSQVLQASPWQLDLNRDGFVSWDEVFQMVRDQTKAIFNDRASPRLREIQDTQEPISFSLGRRLDDVGRLPDPVVADTRPTRTVGVTISNPTSSTLIYILRWGENGPIKWFVLPPGCHNRHWCAVGDDVPTPQVSYPRTFQGDPYGGFDSYNLRYKEIDRSNRRDLGKRYNFSIESGFGPPTVQLTDPDPPDYTFDP